MDIDVDFGRVDLEADPSVPYIALDVIACAPEVDPGARAFGQVCRVHRLDSLADLARLD
jgi:hypothetical protein